MKKMGLLMIIACTVAGVLIVFYLHQVTNQAIYVAMYENDQHEGTLEHPFQNIAKASSEADAGTTVYIREGTYEESLVVQHSGTKHKPIIF
ncbi:DUF1565 domain-containing protein [Oceanobacillus locisalsi]|uniref:DUF1565 domain-containing protein n=1 Tax=Oceanobacillus locisalsi TaxID=546107 RepID=A0ABW3NCB7_9BACI